MEHSKFCVYIIFSEYLNRFYIGTTDDFAIRLTEHNTLKHENSFTSRGIPWNEFLVIDNLESDQAYEIEKHIKQMKSKKYIADLKQYPEMVNKLKVRFQ